MNNQRSTPKKVQNFAEGSSMKTSRDVIYDELQHLKNETTGTFIANNNNLNKVENSVSENSKTINMLIDQIEKLISHEMEIKEENQNLKIRCDEFEKRIKSFENVKDDYHMLKKKFDEISGEIRDRKNQSSIEDVVKKSLVEFTDKINSSMEDNMNKINNLFITNFTNQMVSVNETKVSSIKPIPSNLSNKESPKAPEKSALNFNKDLSENTSSLLDSNKSILKTSPLKDNNNKSSISFNENQNVNNVPMSGFSLIGANKPAPSLFGLTNSTTNQGTNSLFGGKQQTNIFKDSVDSNKSPNSGTLFGQSKPLFGNITQPNKLIGDSSSTSKQIFGLNSTTNKPNNIDSLFISKTQPIKVDNVNNEPNSSLFSTISSFGSQSNATDQSNKPSFSFTAAANSSNTPSFSSLSQSAADSNSFASNSEAVWQGGSKLFAGKLNTSEHEDTVDQNNQEEEHDPHFQPIIELPPLVALQKDEESHDILFKSRCKLYRFTGTEWKERGVGEMKIMRTKESVDPTRPVKLLMRRDQVRKICCNQRISKNVPAFAEMPNVKSTCWVGNDFSDGEPTPEKFAIRFSHVDELTQFKRIVEEIQAEISSVDKTD